MKHLRMKRRKRIIWRQRKVMKISLCLNLPLPSDCCVFSTIPRFSHSLTPCLLFVVSISVISWLYVVAVSANGPYCLAYYSGSTPPRPYRRQCAPLCASDTPHVPLQQRAGTAPPMPDTFPTPACYCHYLFVNAYLPSAVVSAFLPALLHRHATAAASPTIPCSAYFIHPLLPHTFHLPHARLYCCLPGVGWPTSYRVVVCIWTVTGVYGIAMPNMSSYLLCLSILYLYVSIIKW